MVWLLLLPLVGCAPRAAVPPDYAYEAPVLAGRQPREVAALHARLAQSEPRVGDLEREVARLGGRQAELQQASAEGMHPAPVPLSWSRKYAWPSGSPT